MGLSTIDIALRISTEKAKTKSLQIMQRKVQAIKEKREAMKIELENLKTAK